MRLFGTWGGKNQKRLPLGHLLSRATAGEGFRQTSKIGRKSNHPPEAAGAQRQQGTPSYGFSGHYSAPREGSTAHQLRPVNWHRSVADLGNPTGFCSRQAHPRGHDPMHTRLFGMSCVPFDGPVPELRVLPQDPPAGHPLTAASGAPASRGHQHLEPLGKVSRGCAGDRIAIPRLEVPGLADRCRSRSLRLP
ncbi:MAG: hypothetical protein ACI89E_001816 [Planctomycetota bacterium]|jgi:hypothetical protein